MSVPEPDNCEKDGSNLNRADVGVDEVTSKRKFEYTYEVGERRSRCGACTAVAGAGIITPHANVGTSAVGGAAAQPTQRVYGCVTNVLGTGGRRGDAKGIVPAGW